MDVMPPITGFGHLSFFYIPILDEKTECKVIGYLQHTWLASCMHKLCSCNTTLLRNGPIKYSRFTHQNRRTKLWDSLFHKASVIFVMLPTNTTKRRGL